MTSAPSDIVVFLGPTLPVEEARRILPARYLPPARCGDVLRVRRWKPRAIGIVDGVFEQVAAVWHKEILLALEDGIPVYGASSMGALRAAELERFGMIGVGRIFEAYRDGIHTDDDEVTLVHGRGAEGHVALSDPMVNIRATLERAVQEGVIRAASAERVLARAKATFYKDRSLVDAVARALSADEAAPLTRFLERGGYVDQKRKDALALLERLARLPVSAPPPSKAEPVNKATYILWLHHHVGTSAFAEATSDLPREEQVAAFAPTLGERHGMVRRLAQLLAVAYGMGKTHARPRRPARAGADPLDVLDLAPSARRTRWASAHDLDAPAHAAFLERMRVVGELVRTFERRVGRRVAERRYAARVLDLRRLDGRYAPRRPDALADALDLRAAKIWCALEAAVAETPFAPSSDLASASDELRRSRGLLGREAMFTWMRENDLTAAGYEALLARSMLLEALCSGKYLHALDLRVLAQPVPWLLDALRLAGLYLPLARRADAAPALTRRS